MPRFIREFIGILEMSGTISVIIPALNESKNIGGCLNCLLNQIEKPFEVIVVDNGSTDSTYGLARKFAKKFNEKKIILKVFKYSKGNQTNARNFGIKNSSGQIIGSLDADALPDANWVSKINEHLSDSEVIGIGGKSHFRNKGIFFNFLYAMNYYARLILNFYCIGGGNSAFRKSAFISVKGYSGLEELRKSENILYAKDDYFLSKKLEQIGKVKFCPDLNVALLYRARKNKKLKKADIQNIIKRSVLEIVYDYRITAYMRREKWRSA